jgi:hypothetical protein
MPRNARIDAPGALHHLIVRGIERKEIFQNDADRDFLLSGSGRFYLYDANDRLLKVLKNSAAVEEYDYDENGTCIFEMTPCEAS